MHFVTAISYQLMALQMPQRSFAWLSMNNYLSIKFLFGYFFFVAGRRRHFVVDFCLFHNHSRHHRTNPQSLQLHKSRPSLANAVHVSCRASPCAASTKACTLYITVYSRFTIYDRFSHEFHVRICVDPEPVTVERTPDFSNMIMRSLPLPIRWWWQFLN